MREKATQLPVAAHDALPSTRVEYLAKLFWQGNGSATVEIHRNVNLRGLSAELSITDPCYAVLEDSRGSARARDRDFDINLVSVKDWGAKLCLDINGGKAQALVRE